MHFRPIAFVALAALCACGSPLGEIGAAGGDRSAVEAGAPATVETPADAGIDAAPVADARPTDAAPVHNDAPAPSPPDAAPPVVPAATGVWSMGYYAGYQRDLYPVANIEWSGMTHLAVAFYLPGNDGSLDERLFLDATSGPQLAHDLVAAAHAHGVKAIASIGGAGTGAAMRAASSPATRATFVDTLTQLLTKYGYDGLDIDWEPYDPSDAPAVIALANDVRAKHPGALMTMPIGYLNGNSPADVSSYAGIAAAYDQLNIMSYGMAGAYDGWKSWHSSALHYSDGATPTSVESTVKLYVGASVPKRKLGVGIGFYGMCYSSPVTAPSQPLGGAIVAADDNTMSFTNIMADYFAPAARSWDAMASVPYLSFAAPHGSSNCTFVSYEDAQSIAEKGAFLKAEGLGGVIVWTINQGVVGTKSPLLEAIRDHVMR